MADKFFGKGTSSPVASGNMTPTNPASLAVDDILFCFLSQHDNVAATMPVNWARVTNFPIASGTAVRHDCFWKRVTSTGESSASVTVTRAAGDAGIAVICAFRGLTTSGNPFNTSATQANASSTTVTMPTVTPSAAGQTIIFSAGVADDGAFGAVSGADPAPTERHDELTALGLDVSILVATGERSVSTATGNRTSTNARAAVNVGAQIALTTAAGGGSTIVEADGASAGVASSAVIGAAIWAAVAASAGVAAPTAVAASLNQTVGSSAGIAAPTAVAASFNQAAGSSDGVAAVSGVGSSINLAEGSSSGVATVSGAAEDAAAGAGADGLSEGVATVSGITATIFASEGVSAGVATASGVASSTAQSVAASSGVGAVSGVGAATVQTVGSSSGVAAVSGQIENAGASSGVVEATGSSAGAATVSGEMATVIPSVGTSAVSSGTSASLILVGRRWALRIGGILYEWLT